jgi:hypothetical protein
MNGAAILYVKLIIPPSICDGELVRDRDTVITVSANTSGLGFEGLRVQVAVFELIMVATAESPLP